MELIILRQRGKFGVGDLLFQVQPEQRTLHILVQSKPRDGYGEAKQSAAYPEQIDLHYHIVTKRRHATITAYQIVGEYSNIK